MGSDKELDSDEYTDDDELDGIERYTTTYDILEPTRKLMDLIKDKEETMFPIVLRKRRLDPTVFDYI